MLATQKKNANSSVSTVRTMAGVTTFLAMLAPAKAASTATKSSTTASASVAVEPRRFAASPSLQETLSFQQQDPRAENQQAARSIFQSPILKMKDVIVTVDRVESQPSAPRDEARVRSKIMAQPVDYISPWDSTRKKEALQSRLQGFTGNDIQRQVEIEKFRAESEVTDMRNEISRFRVAKLYVDLPLLNEMHVSYSAAKLEGQIARSQSTGGGVRVAVDLAADLIPGRRVIEKGIKIAMKELGQAYIDSQVKDAAAYRAVLKMEYLKAIDPIEKANTDKILQQLADENPRAYDALQKRYSTDSALPSRKELQNARKAQDIPLSIVRKGAAVKQKFSEDEQRQIKEDLTKLQVASEKTETTLQNAAQTEVRLKKASEALQNKMDQLLANGADPEGIKETKEYKIFCEAERDHSTRIQEFFECVDSSVSILSRFDPQAGAVFSRSMKLGLGLQAGLANGLSKLKLTDFLSITSLGLALFDAFLMSGPDVTQQYLENITKMLEGMDEKLDNIDKRLTSIQTQMLEEFSKLEDNVEGARFEAKIFHQRTMEAIRDGMNDILNLQVDTLKVIMGLNDKIDDISHRISIQLEQLVLIRTHLDYTNTQIKSIGVEIARRNLEAALADNGQHLSGAEGLIADYHVLKNDLFSVANLLAESPMLHTQDRTQRGNLDPKIAEGREIDIQIVDFRDHPIALADALVPRPKSFFTYSRTFREHRAW